MSNHANWNPKRAKAADVLRYAAEQSYNVEERVIARTKNIALHIANHIDDGNLTAARKMAKNHWRRVFIPNTTMKILYPKDNYFGMAKSFIANSGTWNEWFERQ